MKLQRWLVAIVCWLLAGLFALVLVAIRQAPAAAGSVVPWQIAMGGLVLALTLSGVYLLRRKKEWEARLRCPHCRQRGTLVPNALGQPHIWLPWYILTGFLALFYAITRPRRYHCGGCGEGAFLRPAGAWLALAWLVVYLGLIFVQITYGDLPKERERAASPARERHPVPLPSRTREGR
jgi:uncharacterized membrane protein (DUF485 family)